MITTNPFLINPECANNRARFKGILLDLFPTERLKVNVLLAAFDEGIVQAIREANELNNHLAGRFIKILLADYGVDEEVAWFAVRYWFSLYGHDCLGKEVSVQYALPTKEKTAASGSQVIPKRQPRQPDFVPSAHTDNLSISKIPLNSKLPKAIFHRDVEAERKYGIIDFSCVARKSFEDEEWSEIKIAGEIKGKCNKEVVILFLLYNSSDMLVDFACDIHIEGRLSGNMAYETSVELLNDEVIKCIRVLCIDNPVFVPTEDDDSDEDSIAEKTSEAKVSTQDLREKCENLKDQFNQLLSDYPINSTPVDKIILTAARLDYYFAISLWIELIQKQGEAIRRRGCSWLLGELHHISGDQVYTTVAENDILKEALFHNSKDIRWSPTAIRYFLSIGEYETANDLLQLAYDNDIKRMSDWYLLFLSTPQPGKDRRRNWEIYTLLSTWTKIVTNPDDLKKVDEKIHVLIENDNGEEIARPLYMSAYQPKVKTREQKNDDVVMAIQNAGFECVDNRNSSSILWVIFDAERKEEFAKLMDGIKKEYKLEKRGAVATKNRPAWRIMLR